MRRQLVVATTSGPLHPGKRCLQAEASTGRSRDPLFVVFVATSFVVLSCVLMGANALDVDEALPASKANQAGGGFFYWLLDSFMWAVALYYIITRRAEFVQLFQRVAEGPKDELTERVEEVEQSAVELAARYDELVKDLGRIRNSRRHAQLTAALSALDVATRRMLDALPTESKKDSSSTSERADKEGTSADLDAAHNADAGVEPSTASAQADRPDATQASLQSNEEEQKVLAEEKPHPETHGQEEKHKDKPSDDDPEASPIEDSGSDKSDLGYSPDGIKATYPSIHVENDEEDKDEAEERNSAGAISALGARRKRRLRSRRSVKCRAGEYDDTAGEAIDLTRSGSEPDSDASEHRSSDASTVEPLDPSSQFINEDVDLSGSPSRPHYRKKKPKTRNLKRSSKKMGRSKDAIHTLLTEENARLGQEDGYSEEGDGEAEDLKDKLLLALGQNNEDSGSEKQGSGVEMPFDLDELKAQLEGNDHSDSDSSSQKKVEESEEEISDSWRRAESSQSSEDEAKNNEDVDEDDFKRLVEEGDDESDHDQHNKSKFSLDDLKAQLADLDALDSVPLQPQRSESFALLQGKLEGLSFDSEATDEPRKTDSLAPPSTSKRRSLRDIFDLHDIPADASTQASSDTVVDGVVRDIAARDDINLPGLRRAKKTSNNFGSAKRGSKSIKPQYNMEDAHTIAYPFHGDANRAFIAVLDGHAGMDAAQKAAKLLPTQFKACLDAASPSNNDLREVFTQTFAEVDSQLKEFEFEGATATVVFIWRDGEVRYLQAANVGDSAAFLRRGDDVVKLTYDHKVTDPGERERLINAGVELSPNATRINGMAVSRALGDHFMKENETGLIGEPHISDPIQLSEEDSLLLVATDGLWDIVSGAEAMTQEDASSAEEIASSLLRTAVSSSLCVDNVTVVAARL